jgi:hypothetical protein
VGFVNGCWVIGWGFVAKVAFFLALRPDAMSDGAGIGDSRVFYTSWKQDLYDIRQVDCCTSYISPFEIQFFSNNHGEVMKVRCEINRATVFSASPHSASRDPNSSVGRVTSEGCQRGFLVGDHSVTGRYR